MNETPMQPAPAPTPAPATPSSKLSLWSLILGISALVLALVIFISLPAAIVAVILGIMALVKRRPGKGMALAGVITGGLALIIIPIVFTIALVAYNGITERANKAVQTATEKSTVTPKNDRFVDTDCYSYAYPEGYEVASQSKDCLTAINIPKGDALTRIVVKGNTGTVGTLSNVVATLNAALKKSDPNSAGIIDQEELTVNGETVYYVSYKDATGLLFGNYIFPQSSSSQTLDGKPVTAYTVAGYVYNSSLKEIVRGVVDSLDIN